MTDPIISLSISILKNWSRSFPILGKGQDEKIANAIELFRSSKKPVIYSGGGTIQANASKN